MPIKNLRLILFFFYFLYQTDSTAAQLYHFIHYPSEDGLSGNSILSIVQDRKGVMYLEARNGINKLNGFHRGIYYFDGQEKALMLFWGTISGIKELKIILNPSILAMLGAYLVCALIISGIIFYLSKTFYNKIQHQKERETNESRIEFFTNIIHEIKTPLTLIKISIENINEIAFDSISLKKNVEMLERNSNRLSDLVDQLMDFRKIEANRFILNLQKTDIQALLTETFNSFKSLAHKKGLTYSLHQPKHAVTIDIDVEAVRKIITNLLSNAIKYAEEEVRVSILDSFPGKHKNRIEIIFENDGQLIPQELKQKIFEPFFQIPRSFNQNSSGIGLALAKFLTDLHDGKLYLSESVGKNIFILELPHSSVERGYAY